MFKTYRPAVHSSYDYTLLVNVLSLRIKLAKNTGVWVTVKCAGMPLTRPCSCVPHRLHVAVSPRSRGASFIYWSASHTPLVAIGGAFDHAHRIPTTAFERMNVNKAEERSRQAAVFGRMSHVQDKKQLAIKDSDDFTPTHKHCE